MLGPNVVLREEDKEPVGGGAADDAPFTETQLAALQQLIASTANSAVTAQLKRNLPVAIADGLKGVNFGEILAPEIAKLKPAEPSAEKKPAESEFTKQIQDLAAKLEASESARAGAERARIDAEQKRLHDSALSQLRNHLQPKLRDDLLDVAVSHWANTEGRLKVTDDGQALLRVKRAAFKGGPEQDEDLPLAEAIPLLLASKEAKPFIPAPGGQQEKGGPAKQPRAPFVASQSSTSADMSDTAKAQSTVDALAKLGINDLAEILG